MSESTTTAAAAPATAAIPTPAGVAPAVPTVAALTPVHDGVAAFKATVTQAEASVNAAVMQVQKTVAGYAADLQAAMPAPPAPSVLTTATADAKLVGSTVAADVTAAKSVLAQFTGGDWIAILVGLGALAGGFAWMVHVIH